MDIPARPDPGLLWRRFILRVGGLFVFSSGVFFVYNYFADADQIHEAALKRARAHHHDTLLLLRWASNYGGVYVELRPDEQRPANPHHNLTEKRTYDGYRHHLLHPDGILAEIGRMARNEGGHGFRLIGRQTRDPANAPDTWETIALDSLIGGREEYHATIEDGARVLFRYMAPVLTEASCLKCHGDEGLRVGDVHGGISIDFDISELLAANLRHQVAAALLLLASLLVSLFAARWFAMRHALQLRDINQRYEDLLQSTESIIWEADPETMELTFVSDQVDRLLGFRSDECLNQVFWSRCISPQDIGRVWEACKSHRDKAQPLRHDYRMIDSKGVEHWMQDVVVYAERSDGRPVLRGILLDISERKTAEKRVQDMLAEQYAILQNAMVGIALIRHSQVISCNYRFEEIFGASRFSLTGKPVRALYPNESVYADIRARVKTAFDRGDTFNEELQLSRQDGSLFWGAMSGQLLNPADPSKGAIWIYADISERMAAQAALKEHQARLEQLVEQRTADLRRALDAAHSADRAKDEFLANVSHEMRTPLNAVIGLSSLASKHSQDPRVRDYLDKVAGAGKTLLQIINDLLDLSKIAAGHIELENIPFLPREICERVSLLVAHRIEDKQLSFETHVDPALPAVVVGDPLRVEQIAINLLSNAIKFTDRGKITLRFMRMDAPPGKVGMMFSVADTGMGMTSAERERLFQPFSQGDSSIARTHGGTGLGLTICRRFAEMMHGDINVESVRGTGSTFIVKLILDEAGEADAAVDTAAAAATLAQAVDQIRYRDTRVLVVDDQPINRQIVCELLAEVGITCEEAADGHAALARLTGQPPDHYALVFMDVQMPEMDGHTATRKLRAHAAFAALPVIAMTAFAMEHERRACLAAGMNDHLGKPFEPQRFYQLLAHWIPASRQYRIAATPAAAPTKEAVPMEEHAAPPPVSRASPDALEIAGIDTAAGIARFAGNQDAYRRWLANFVQESTAPLDAVLQQLAAGDRPLALRTLHAFKGRCGMLGMTVLWQTIVDLEGAMKEAQETEAQIAVARTEHAAVIARVQAALGG